MTVATLERRVKRLETQHKIGQMVSAIMEQGGDHAYLSTGERVSLEELERLAELGRLSCVREYPACYLGV